MLVAFGALAGVGFRKVSGVLIDMDRPNVQSLAIT